MDAETWMNAREALRLGFIDQILTTGDASDETEEESEPMLILAEAIRGLGVKSA